MISKLKADTETLLKEKTAFREIVDERYAHMKYPKFIPMMRFETRQYEIDKALHLMIMHTRTKMGMELLTMSFMPQGVTMPYLLVDAMTMKKKRCVFVEYYGCGYGSLSEKGLSDVYERYRHLEDYPEKGNWYVGERRPYSLIKTGSEEELLQMTRDSLEAYLGCMEEAVCDEEYERDLEAFCDRMIKEGNPSSKTLQMLLGKQGAVTFMKEVVMPIDMGL